MRESQIIFLLKSVPLTLALLYVCDRVGPLLSAPAELGDTEETLSLDEKLRRERKRAYTLGITHYAWPPVTAQGSGRRLLIPLQVRRREEA